MLSLLPPAATQAHSLYVQDRAPDSVKGSDTADLSCRKSRLSHIDRGVTAADLDCGIDFFAVQGAKDRARLEASRGR